MQQLLTTSSIKQLHHATTFNHKFYQTTPSCNNFLTIMQPLLTNSTMQTLLTTSSTKSNNSIMQQLLTTSSIKQLHHATTFNHEFYQTTPSCNHF